jgi:hypothetical protein
VYFKARGFNYFPRANQSTELVNIDVRIKAFGNEQNPDSLRVEFAQNTNVRVEKLFNSAKKDTVCYNKECMLPDNEAPRILSCPSNKVLFPLETNVTTISSDDIMKFTGIKAYDDCSLADIRTYPYNFYNVTNGKQLNYHTVAYDSAGNQSICRFQVKFLSPANDTCFTSFKMNARSKPTCEGASAVSRFSPSITLLGKRIADGIEISKSPMSAGGSEDVIFGRNGSPTPPAGARFIACPGNWTYFTMSGWSKTARSNQNIELINRVVRIKYFGNEANPDSLKVEFAEKNAFLSNRFFSTSHKTIHCNPCQSKDKIAPVIRNCPTQMVRYPVLDATDVEGAGVAKFANIQVSDNCALADVSTYPHRVFNPKKGQIVDYHTVAYDEVGHKSVCNFKAQFVAAPCNLYTKPILQYLGGYEQTIIAAAGQNCKVATWEEPTVNDNSSFNPVKITSNYPSGHCFPIGTTQVWYTAKDSCGKTDRASFNVTVRAYNVPYVARLSNDNQQVTMDIKSLSPNPTDGALLMRLKSIVEKEVTFDFYNTVGSKVYSQTQRVQKGENELFFEVTKLPTGVYFIQTSEFSDKNASTKFVKY